MKKLALLSILCLSLAAASAWAGEIGTTNAALFNDSVDWCQAGFGCAGTTVPSGTAWTSAGSLTGTVGLANGEDFYNVQQGATWFGNFADGEGVIYNGAAYGNDPADITISFDQTVYGVGAYIQGNAFGPFAATIDLYDASNNLLLAFHALGVSDNEEGTALFIGGLGGTPVAYANFHAVGGGPFEPDFAIGTLDLSTTPTITPEPCSMLLMGSFLGVLGFIRRKLF